MDVIVLGSAAMVKKKKEDMSLIYFGKQSKRFEPKTDITRHGIDPRENNRKIIFL